MKKKILLVEDAKSLREWLKLPLEYANYEVIEAMDGLEALGLFGETDFDLIITDFDMPNLNGIEWILMAKQRFSKKIPPTLVLTNHSIQKNEVKKYSFFHCIEKPLLLDKILSKVDFLMTTFDIT
ncbi:MAG: response regulator [Bacteroidetes bacterium]|nr:MAG: response regulator [Bacteroidota bacterium]TAG88172.1 MAG: response regulator [Bacteroidota bacterium]